MVEGRGVLTMVDIDNGFVQRFGSSLGMKGEVIGHRLKVGLKQQSEQP
jgi:hypothetical protein